MVARVEVPRQAKRGEIIEVRIAIQHPMETGFRLNNFGKPIAKNVVNQLVCRYNGEEVFRAEMGSGIAANPYLQFHTRQRTRAHRSDRVRPARGLPRPERLPVFSTA